MQLTDRSYHIPTFLPDDATQCAGGCGEMATGPRVYCEKCTLKWQADHARDFDLGIRGKQALCDECGGMPAKYITRERKRYCEDCLPSYTPIDLAVSGSRGNVDSTIEEMWMQVLRERYTERQNLQFEHVEHDSSPSIGVRITLVKHVPAGMLHVEMRVSYIVHWHSIAYVHGAIREMQKAMDRVS